MYKNILSQMQICEAMIMMMTHEEAKKIRNDIRIPINSQGVRQKLQEGGFSIRILFLYHIITPTSRYLLPRVNLCMDTAHAHFFLHKWP